VSADAIVDQHAPRTESRWLVWLSVIALVYLLLVAVSLIEVGFKTASGDQARRLFDFAANPLVAVMIGMVATALIQSSSTVTSIIVGLVAGGLPIAIAVPMIMGANIGTSLTSTLVSLGSLRSGPEFRRAFSAATIHDSFNVLAVAIWLPFEVVFHPLERLSGLLAPLLGDGGDVNLRQSNVLKMAIAPVSNQLAASVAWLPSNWAGSILALLGVILILLVVSGLGKVLRRAMTGRAQRLMQAAVGGGPLTGMGCGAVVTMLVQSSSTTTSLMVPLAASEVFTLRQVYPFTLGANVGTTITALLASAAIAGPTAVVAHQIAIVHLLFNLLAILVIYGFPPLRNVPVTMAEWLTSLASRSVWYVLAYIIGLFFLLPLLLIALTSLF